MDAILKKIGICCFTEDPYDMGMWSHYGGQHKGFCVEYDCTEGTQLRALVKPVKYSDMRASVPRGIHVSVNDIDPDSFSESWLIKSTSWTQEKEWRVMKNDGGRLYKNLSNVKSIIFGARTLQDDIELMKKCMRHKQRIIFKKMSLVEDSFKLQMDTLRSDDSY